VTKDEERKTPSAERNASFFTLRLRSHLHNTDCGMDSTPHPNGDQPPFPDLSLDLLEEELPGSSSQDDAFEVRSCSIACWIRDVSFADAIQKFGCFSR
jgi:hypothetical protein